MNSDSLPDLLTPAPAFKGKPTTAAIMDALRERYCAPEFSMFEEVGDSGSSSRVYADAVALNMWASRGYAISGFEVKASRSDWLRELKQPGKAEPVFTKCDHWYLVAPDEVYQIDEVPVAWGILSFKDGKLRERRKAPALEPKPITRAFVAQMFRRAHNREERDISARVAKTLAADREQMQQTIEHRVKERTHRLSEDGTRWKNLLEQLGQSEWASDETIIAAVRVVLKSGVTRSHSGLEELLRRMRGMVGDLEQASAMFTGNDRLAGDTNK